MQSVVVIGLSCVYPGADNISKFWENIVSRRRCFRNIPKKRLDYSIYGDDSKEILDKTYAAKAAVIDGYDFDWRKNLVPKASFESTDLVHWLALDCAREAIDDAGINLEEVDRSRIGVIVGNSLTGELSRAHMMRLRWPYVREAVARSATASGLSEDATVELLERTERIYKAPFHTPNEDTLAGALANVIAGRICNRLDLNGGGYTVDGACASSLLAIQTGCDLLSAGHLDTVIAGGVDVSLDPLELVGFARTGALTPGEMLVYDRASNGFIPGEGCGFAVLMRAEDAIARELSIWAEVAGWGVSSDGRGGVTAPKAETQAMAISRCYARAPFAASDLDFIEGHGTGTPLGDRVELNSILASTSTGTSEPERRVGVTSVKTIIGHTKAAAGIAGFIKAVLGVNQHVLPPMAGPRERNALFGEDTARIYPITRAREIPHGNIARAGVSSAGFGGINCHVSVTSAGATQRALKCPDLPMLAASPQLAEVIVASAPTSSGLAERLSELAASAEGMAMGELCDFAAATALQDNGQRCRAALCVRDVEDASAALSALAGIVAADGMDSRRVPPSAVLGHDDKKPRIGFLFPGQGSQFLGMGWRFASRYRWASRRIARWNKAFPAYGTDSGSALSDVIDRPLDRCFDDDLLGEWNAMLRDTRAAQPAIAMTSLQWFEFFQRCGVEPDAVAGHSLGEIPAMVAAELLTEQEAIAILKVRAASAAPEAGEGPGAMASLRAGLETVEALMRAVEGYLVTANINAPEQIVVAGGAGAIDALERKADAEGVPAIRLNVQNAFHSRYMDRAAQALSDLAARRGGEKRASEIPFHSALRSGEQLDDFDPYAYLVEQVTGRVQFAQTAARLSADVDIVVEMGPGQVLSGLATASNGGTVPCYPVELPSAASDQATVRAFAALYAAGAAIDWQTFYSERLVRPFISASERSFIANPCELIGEASGLDAVDLPRATGDGESLDPAGSFDRDVEPAGEVSIEKLLRDLIEGETGYGHDMMPGDARLVGDLNLDSIKIGEIRGKLATRGVTFADDAILSTGSIDDIVAAAKRAPVAEAAPGSQDIVGEPKIEVPILRLVPEWRPANDLAVLAPSSVRVIGVAGDRFAADLGKAFQERGWTLEPQGDADRLVIALPESTAADVCPMAELLATAAPLLARVPTAAIIERADPSGATPLVAAALAHSISLERPELPILSLAAGSGDLAKIAEVACARLEPGALPLRLDAGNVERFGLSGTDIAGDSVPCSAGEVILATGGAKGITAACIRALAERTKASVALLGRSKPEEDREVRETLAQFSEAGLTAIYRPCDITDPRDVEEALREIRHETGGAPITGLVHGAGVNSPSTLSSTSKESLARELATKCQGFATVLNALDASALKLCVGFGSVIGVTGMHGNAGYAAANAMLAAQLDALARSNPGCRVRCLAFGVWDEIGMGAKLGVVERLRSLDVHPIPANEGVASFMAAVAGEAPELMVVSGPMQGLPTWRAARRSAPIEGEMLSASVIDEPGHLLIARHALSTETAPWLDDHDFDGARLLPMVFALRAMAEGGRAVTSARRFAAVSDVRIAGPIVVPPGKEVTIETDVRVDDQGIQAGVGSPGAAFRDPRFACRLLPDAGTPPERIAPQGAEVPRELSDALYDWLLFQGPRFQRIEMLTHVDLGDPVRRRAWLRLRRDEEAGPLPDVFFLDAMLQSMQVLVPRDVCLPTGVEAMRFWPDAWNGGAAEVRAEILAKTEMGYLGRVTAFDAGSGAPLVLIDGLELVAATQFADRPDLPNLLEPLAWDRAAVARFVGETESHVVLGALDATDRAARRAAAREQIAAHAPEIAVALDWNEDGAPILPERLRTGVSISHDGGRLLTATGPGVRGCDLQTLGRTGRNWGEVLPAGRQEIWREAAGRVGNPDLAAAMVWSADEALVKAGYRGDNLELIEAGRTRLRFSSSAGEVRAGIVQLALAGPAAIALCTDDGEGPLLMRLAAPARIDHFHHRFSMSFKEALPPLRAATAPVIFGWVGDLREKAMEEIVDPLVDAFLNRSKGILTNFTDLRMSRPPRFGVPIDAWVWIEQVLASQPSTFDLRFAFAQPGSDGRPVACAEARQRLTWVHLESDGRPTIEPFPEFFDAFIGKRRPREGEAPWRPPVVLKGLGPDRSGGGEARESIAMRMEVLLDESYSNFVGNIYFSHLALLADRACRRALDASGQTSRYFARALRLDHLGEAMPGDSVEVRARHRHAHADRQTMNAEIVNLSRGGASIAVATLEYMEAARAVATA